MLIYSVSSLTQVVFSSCELGVFDLLLSAERPLSAEEISQAIGASLDGIQRLLAACTGLKLLNTLQDNGQGQHTHTKCIFVHLSHYHTFITLSIAAPPYLCPVFTVFSTSVAPSSPFP